MAPVTSETENVGHVQVAARLRERLLTGSATRLKFTAANLLREFGIESGDPQSLAAVGETLARAGLECHPDVNKYLSLGSEVTVRAGRLKEAPVRVVAPIVAVDAQTAAAQAVRVSTTFEIPGMEIVEFYGEVFGLVVRSRNAISNLGASAKAIVGGELGGLSKLLADARADAMLRMRMEAEALGANAVIGMRYDSSEIGGTANEVVAYGTAVRVKDL